MRKCNIINGKMYLFLVAAILILCTGFFIVGCGAGPAAKATNYNVGNFAVDFNAADGTDVVALNVSNAYFPSITGNTLTVEAWIKPKATSTSASGIFGRYDSTGAVMWVKNTDTSTLSTPKFAIRVIGTSTSTDYTVSSGADLENDTWYHVAGVLSNTAHPTHTITTSCTTTVRSETPHLDIYVDGEFMDCATTWGDSSDTATAPQGVTDPAKAATADSTINSAEIGYLKGSYTPLVDGASATTQFEGVIDEVRIWTSERTATEIDNCKDVELSTTSSECNIGDANLIGYWKFNEGSGSDVHDASGQAVNGAMEVGTTHWDEGWVTGKYE